MKQPDIQMKLHGLWFWSKLKTLTQKIFSIEDTPEKIARGFALGTFIGMTPFVGLHLFISVLVARILNWNKIAAGIAVFHTNLFTGTFIIGLNYTIGAVIIGSENTLNLNENNGSSLILNIFNSGSSLFFSLLIGGLITGIPAAFFAYFLLKKIFSKKQPLNT
ncbi:MAG: DUF2062 domain-containing protein [Bacteroidota bacterium]|nr:DUF2062 domain-containing protein [Bacteroidota bacterium]